MTSVLRAPFTVLRTRKGALETLLGTDTHFPLPSSSSWDRHTFCQWILGQGWNETDWAKPRMPTKEILDQAVPHHPVLLWRCDLHLAAANSMALKLAGIDAHTPDPPEGRIDRDKVVVHAEPVKLCIMVGKKTPLQHFVR